MANLDFIYKRHSVRKFKNQDVPNEDIKEMIKAATYAPSGKNCQGWHFVVVKNKVKIKELVEVIERKNAVLADKVHDEAIKESFVNLLKYQTAFRFAPVVILIYAEKYIPTGLEIMKAANWPEEEIYKLRNSQPGVQGVSAAIENLMIAAANMGYGTCWMTGPVYAAKEIDEVLGFNKEGYSLIAVTPLGIPENTEIKSPSRKPVEDVITLVK